MLNLIFPMLVHLKVLPPFYHNSSLLPPGKKGGRTFEAGTIIFILILAGGILSSVLCREKKYECGREIEPRWLAQVVEISEERLIPLWKSIGYDEPPDCNVIGVPGKRVGLNVCFSYCGVYVRGLFDFDTNTVTIGISEDHFLDIPALDHELSHAVCRANGEYPPPNHPEPEKFSSIGIIGWEDPFSAVRSERDRSAALDRWEGHAVDVLPLSGLSEEEVDKFLNVVQIVPR